jgi:transposase-like protein
MEDYPRTALELEDRFGSEESCLSYLASLRWPEGFVCPRCQASGGWPASRGRWICRHCRYQASVTAGTIFQDTRKPLRMWFRAVWHVTSQKTGASAVSLQQELGLGSYLTAWTWLHKLRRAMVRPGRNHLQGRVEVDETLVGGEGPGPGHRLGDKALVAIAAEENGAGIGRIRLGVIPQATRLHLHEFIRQSILPGSVVHTDGLRAYTGLEPLGFQHQVTALSRQGGEEAASRLLPRVHRIASLLKRWLLGTHQGAVSNKHLPYYLDEFTFRFNRRTSRSRGKLFYGLLQQAVQVGPHAYDRIIDRPAGEPNHKI